MDDKWFKAQQKKAGVTAEDIARRMGRSRSNVSHILNGHQRMSLPWAQAFAETLGVSVAEVLERAGEATEMVAQQLRPGFSESDVTAWVPNSQQGADARLKSIAEALGANRPGIDVWQVKSRAMVLGGFLERDFLIVDTHLAERVQPGDAVIAQIYNNSRASASTVLRRFQPPVLVAASVEPDDMRVHVVDGVNVVIRGKVIASWRTP